MRTRIFVVFTFMMLISLPGKTSLYCKLGDAIITYNQQSELLLKQVIMKITLRSTFFYKSVTRYKICFPLFEIIILNITSSGDYFDLSNHLHR